MRTLHFDPTTLLDEQQLAAAERSIEHWHRLLMGDGLSRNDLLFAALQLQKALRAREKWGKARVRVCCG